MTHPMSRVAPQARATPNIRHLSRVLSNARLAPK